MIADRADEWVCGYCGRFFVVPSLARDCERKHDEGKEEVVELVEDE